MRLTLAHLMELQFLPTTGYKGWQWFRKDRILVGWSEQSIKVRMIQCSCILVQRKDIELEEFKAFLQFVS